jgi:glycerophosphoryl diester phosphodiesterase
VRDIEQLDPEESLGGTGVGGPPWILGHRGSPREAPENTLASLRRALLHGLDGVEYDVRASVEGEPLLIHDETVTRTTGGAGVVEEKSLTELLQLDAGGWFHKRFAGEPLPLLEEALVLRGAIDEDTGDHGALESDGALHMIELKQRGLVERVDQLVREQGLERRIRIASFSREDCLEARDRGLPAMLLAVEAEERDLQFVRDERIDAHGVAASGWRRPAGGLDWPCERWAWSVDSPEDLLWACRAPLFGFNTNEPRRALAVRALVAATPEDDGPYPLQVERLEVDQSSPASDGAEWVGDWCFDLHVRNPFPHAVEFDLGFVGRRGVYDISGEPTSFELERGAERSVRLELSGGSWSPGPDPALMARFAWSGAPGRRTGELILDTPLVRSRSIVLRDTAQRLRCLRESPSAPEASVTVQRNGRALLMRLESSGGLEDAQLLAHLDGVTRLGTRGLRMFLPEDFDDREGGVAFSVGVVGFDRSRPAAGPVYRRWSGGLPPDLLSGEPGRLYPAP